MVSHFFNHKHGRILIKHLVDRNHLPHLHQGLDHFSGLNRHLVSQVRNTDGFRNTHFANDGFGILHLLNLGLFMATIVAVFARTTPLFIAVIVFIKHSSVALVAAAMLHGIVPLAACAMAGTGVLSSLFLTALIFIAITVVILIALLLVLVFLAIGRLFIFRLHHRGLGLIHHFANSAGLFLGFALSFLTTLQFIF